MIDALVRSSSLTELPDCERRFAARHLGELVTAAGFELRRVGSQIGAKIGTAVHAGAARILRAKMRAETAGGEAVDEAIETLRSDVATGAVWDDVSPTMNDAEKQTARMIHIYRVIVAPQIEPVAVEHEMVARFSPTLRLIGHLDVAQDDEVRDIKTGVLQRPNHPQYGSYSLLRRSAGHTVSRFVEDYVPRSSVNRTQREPTSTEYPVASCEQAARAVLKRLDGQIAAFVESADPWVFLPNPASMLCSDRFCPAWGTMFCRVHRGAK